MHKQPLQVKTIFSEYSDAGSRLLAFFTPLLTKWVNHENSIIRKDIVKQKIVLNIEMISDYRTALIRKGLLISNVTILRKRRKTPLTQDGFLASVENCTDPLLCTLKTQSLTDTSKAGIETLPIFKNRQKEVQF